jgi:hypothetical protein
LILRGLLRPLVSLGIGGCLYVLFRPQQLVLFVWLDGLGLTRAAQRAREWAAPWQPDLPAWVIYTLPGMLWLYSMIEICSLIWSSDQGGRRAVIAIIGVAAAGLEISEAVLHGTGTFSYTDLAAIVLVVAAVLGADRLTLREEEE